MHIVNGLWLNQIMLNDQEDRLVHLRWNRNILGSDPTAHDYACLTTVKH